MRTPKLSKKAAFLLEASIIVFFLAGSSAPTPLYALYQQAWGFSPIAITAIFGIYAIAVLATLLVVGSLSDFVGRRPILFVTALLQVVAMVMFVRADGLYWLLGARVVQGIATGAAAGAVGAGMLDIDREKGTIANAVGPMLGTATGAILSGLLVQYLPAPTKLVYVVLALVFATQAVLVLLMPETTTRQRGALASLRPKIHLPAQIREPFMIAVPALVGSWALAGFYGSLGPTLVRTLTPGSTSRALGGIALFVLAVSGVTAVIAMHRKSPRAMMTFGTSALIVGVATTLIAVEARSFGVVASLVVFFAGLVIAGAGFGGSFQGGLRSVVSRAGAHERAGVLSVLYIVAYLSMGLPAVLGGMRVVQSGDFLNTTREYAFVVMALSALALLGTLFRSNFRPAEALSKSPYQSVRPRL